MEGERNCTFHTIVCASFALAVLLRYPVADVQAVVCFLVRVDPAFYHWGRHGVNLELEENSTAESGTETMAMRAKAWKDASRGAENGLEVRFVGSEV
jgi:hypothetical protein